NVFDSLDGVFSTYAEQLDALLDESAAAANLAVERAWAAAHAANAVDEARAALAWADAQLRRAMSEAGDGDITAAGRISALEGQRWHARLQLNAAEEAHEAAIAALDLSRGTHTELSQSAARLTWCAC